MFKVLVEQELLTLPEHLSSPSGFQWGLCYSIFSFICMFCRLLFVLLYFYFGHCVVCPSSICGFCIFGIFKLFIKPIRNVVNFRVHQEYGKVWVNFIKCGNGSCRFFLPTLTRFRSIFRTIEYLPLPKFTISSFYMFFKLSQTNNICVYNVYR